MITSTNEWQFRAVNSLVKVYPDYVPSDGDREAPLSVFVGETASFQIAIRPPGETGTHVAVGVTVSGQAAKLVRLAVVDLVPCDLPAFPNHDDGYDRDEPGLYPDVLRPVVGGSFVARAGEWNALWVDFTGLQLADAGSHEIEISLLDLESHLLHRHRTSVTVIPAELPPLSITNSHYLHCDSLAQYYGVEVFSEEHWTLIDSFLKSATAMGVNSTMTPIWTPSLDTEKGGRRLTTQLLDVDVLEGKYIFGFDKLGRWLDICRRRGITFLEMAHFFTQWGAEATPSIFGRVDGELVELFGWHIGADDPSYRAFLEQLMPELKDYLRTNWDLTRVAFHISDEPSGEQGLANYLRAQAVVSDLVAPCIMIESLNDIAFYNSGGADHPVVATDAVEPFLEARVPDLWVYYCVAQDRDVANRFFAQPATRNRVLGHQLFAFGCTGFVHWGFNFYNSQLSRRAIDPFQDTTASGAFPGGDTFIVYPGEDGIPLESIRYKVFAQAMFDIRAMTWLSELTDRNNVLELIDTDGVEGPLTFAAFSYDPQHYLGVRHEINERIRALLPN